MIRRKFNGTLKEALTSPAILAGDVLLLRGVVFSGDYVSTISDVVVKPYENEKPVIDGSLTINGKNTHWQDLEIRYSGWTDRRTPNNKWLVINGAGSKVSGCNIHDLEGVGFWSQAVSAEMSANVITNIGRMDGATGYGHSLYVQNETGRKAIKNNIMGDSFNWNIHAYAEAGRVDNLDIDGNINYRAGVLSGSLRDDILIGGVNAVGIVMENNCTYGGRLGFLNFAAKTIEIGSKNNYFSNGASFTGAVFTYNTDNTIGIVGDRVFILPVSASRLHVAIYNQAEAKSINIDVSKFFADGVVLSVRNAQDYYNDIQTATVKDGSITVSMTGRTVASPYMWSAPASTFPRFGAFVVMRQ